MGYREVIVPSPKPEITIDGESYDIDYFGMDDGKAEEPDAAFRFLFQLGAGYSMYLYVIQAGGQTAVRRDHFNHSFWFKGVITVDMEPEEHGPPKTVCAPSTPLPVIYPTVTFGPPGEERTLRVLHQRFEAASVDDMVMELALEGETKLLWSPRRAWDVEGAGARSTLGSTARLVFE